jgi:hypothetical protein
MVARMYLSKQELTDGTIAHELVHAMSGYMISRLRVKALKMTTGVCTKQEEWFAYLIGDTFEAVKTAILRHE